jgi:hypothetical protein
VIAIALALRIGAHALVLRAKKTMGVVAHGLPQQLLKTVQTPATAFDKRSNLGTPMALVGDSAGYLYPSTNPTAHVSGLMTASTVSGASWRRPLNRLCINGRHHAKYTERHEGNSPERQGHSVVREPDADQRLGPVHAMDAIAPGVNHVQLGHGLGQKRVAVTAVVLPEM